MLLVLAELMVVPMLLRDRYNHTSKWDDAGAFTYTLQDSLGNALPGGTSLMQDR
jgi:hypothetical protein